MDEQVLRAKAGDRDAFKDLYLAHHAPLYRLALSELRDPEEAKEIVQEAFVRAWQAIGGFRGESAFLAWLFRIVRNLLIDRARSRKRHPTEPRDDEGSETRGDRIASSRPGPETRAVKTEEQARFRSALAGLPESQRAVFLLREWEGMDYREIGVRLGLADGTVKSRLARARDALALALREDAA